MSRLSSSSRCKDAMTGIQLTALAAAVRPVPGPHRTLSDTLRANSCRHVWPSTSLAPSRSQAPRCVHPRSAPGPKQACHANVENKFEQVEEPQAAPWTATSGESSTERLQGIRTPGPVQPLCQRFGASCCQRRRLRVLPPSQHLLPLCDEVVQTQALGLRCTHWRGKTAARNPPLTATSAHTAPRHRHRQGRSLDQLQHGIERMLNARLVLVRKLLCQHGSPSPATLLVS